MNGVQVTKSLLELREKWKTREWEAVDHAAVYVSRCRRDWEASTPPQTPGGGVVAVAPKLLPFWDLDSVFLLFAYV